MAGFGKSDSSSSSTGRTQSKSLFPTEFIDKMHKSLGGPFTVNDMFNLAPRGRSMFGNAPTGPLREGGGYTLGFGAPKPGEGPGAAPAPPPPTGGAAPPPQQGPRRYSLSDLESAYVGDPDKLMDIPRLLKSANLDPGGFTYDDLERAVGKAKKYGFSGRSRGNLARVLGGLQRDTELEDEFGGGKGTGIF